MPRSATLARPLRALARARGRLLLAVSGGLDSMVLLHLATRQRALRERLVVATFDHGTGRVARAGVRLVRTAARRHGVPVITGRARSRVLSEAEWRAQRWAFLREAAAARNATVVTAHTRDDQLETVVMRAMRGASARGLAGLYAGSDVVRPFLHVSRRALERYAREHRIAWVEDPTNRSRRFLRNRIRLDLLPALERARPGFGRAMLRLARDAAALRRRTERMAQRLIRERQPTALVVDAERLRDLPPDSVALLWPAIVAELGIAMDRRGIARACSFTREARPGSRMQCSGNVEIEAARAAFLVRAGTAAKAEPASTQRSWSLRRVSRPTYESLVQSRGAVWGAALDSGVPFEVRSWRPGDRVRVRGLPSPRRIKRYFSEYGIPASERGSWPVVVADGEVVWVPGICHAEVASGGKGKGRSLTYLICERRLS